MYRAGGIMEHLDVRKIIAFPQPYCSVTVNHIMLLLELGLAARNFFQPFHQKSWMLIMTLPGNIAQTVAWCIIACDWPPHRAYPAQCWPSCIDSPGCRVWQGVGLPLRTGGLLWLRPPFDQSPDCPATERGPGERDRDERTWWQTGNIGGWLFCFPIKDKRKTETGGRKI